MHLAAYKLVLTNTLPTLRNLKVSLDKKSEEFKDIVKIGRTHMMDATPITLGQEFSAFSKQIENGIISLENSLKFILEIALGGTAVGTGLNTPDGYSEKVAEIIAKETNYPFVSAENKFEALSSNDSLVDCHGSLKKIAVALNKISNDIRMLSSGPRSGIGEIILPANEPGSSIMPGKVNPTQCEAMSMVCSQVVGNDTAITFSASQGHFQLNVFKPVIIYNFINSSKLISDAVNSFNSNCVKGIIPNLKSIKDKLDNSLMLVTALNPKIGYYKAAEIANNAYKNDTTLREEAIKSGYLTAEEYDQLVDPKSMI
jgi:fumarate hydratase class II